MATGAYIGSTTSRKIKSLYIGVNNISKKIKKAYIGANNKARLWWKTANIPPINSGSVYSITGSPRHADVIDAKTSTYGLSLQYDIYRESKILVFVNSSGVATKIEQQSSNYQDYYETQSGSTANHIFVYHYYGVNMYNNSLVSTTVSNNTTYLTGAAVASFSSKVIFMGGYTSSDPTEQAHIYNDSGVYTYVENFESRLGLSTFGREGIYKHIIKFKDRYIYYANYVLTQEGMYWRMVTENIVLVATGSEFVPYAVAGVVHCIDDGSVAYCMGGIGYGEFNPGQMISARSTGVINHATLYTSQFPGYVGGVPDIVFGYPIAVGENTYSPHFMNDGGTSGAVVGAIIDRNGTFIHIGEVFGCQSPVSYLRMSNEDIVYIGVYRNIIKYSF